MSIVNEQYWTPKKGRELALKYEKLILLISFLYIPSIFILQRFMKKRKEIEAKVYKIIWNLSLSFLSFIGALLIIIYDKNILKSLIIEETEYSPETRAVICIFTLTKFVEYGDTLFLILKKKKLTFLHSYHHFSVVIYCLYSQKELVSHAHYFVFFNLIVHSIMYFYFGFIYILPKIVIKMRKFITCLQIFQMFVGIFISYYAIKHVDNQVYVNNAIASFTLYLTYAFLFLNFYFNSYYRNIKSNVATYLISIHILGIIGFIMICKSKDILRLFLEVSVGCVFTLTLLNFSFYINKHYYQNIKNKISEKNLIEETDLFNKYKKKYYSNMALLKKITINMIKTCLLCFNGLATYAHDNIFLFVNLYSEKIKKIANDSITDTPNKRVNNNELNDTSSDKPLTKDDLKKKKKPLYTFYTSVKDIYSSSIISYIIWKSPIENISVNLENMKTDQSNINDNFNLLCITKQIIQNYLFYIVCLILPIYYGLKVYNDALLGLCVHGALRWLIELYSTKIFNKTQKLKFH
ncbi:long chain fatty acid elongation enzyme, putative [Plasmodium gallinaceum]|uniref:Elongation of fatty acids protein n=1 Tax=Plasmodium gallinaceum TaxID=5849 RepID=A0A097F765_PLAGA|nr:long chain fatty acid elongation enzyme, putative [Plasmodium gallinaceum]AIT18316.1 long chain fatty acid elongation protein [Plasmodium gallinaceum]CRG96747.1 long chain fatty acid elongation enzyme, putative [Plasmodium gallinaceum]